MGFRPLTERADIEHAWRMFESTMRKGADRLPLYEGWRGGGNECTVNWHKEHGVWASFHNGWSAFGTADPITEHNQSITCQIDPPKKGINRRYAGAFLRDDRGNLYIAHSGKIGGGRKGIGKESFRRRYRGANYQTVIWPDGKETEMVVIGRLDSPRLPAQIGQFVSEVARIKGLSTDNSPSSTGRRKADSFSPEFHGKRAKYKASGPIESTCDHGLVVNALHDAVQGRLGVKPANDPNRDLYIPAGNGDARVLFEVKTDVSTSSIYAAIGQLFFNGACQQHMPKLVAVVPGKPAARTASALAKLGIRVVGYEWEGQQVHISKLPADLK